MWCASSTIAWMSTSTSTNVRRPGSKQSELSFGNANFTDTQQCFIPFLLALLWE